MSKDNTFLLEPEKIELFRIRYANGKYAAGADKESKKGKVWVKRAHLHQHLGQFSYEVSRANQYSRPKTNWTVFPKDIPWFQKRYAGAVVINETTGEEVDALEYIDHYYRNVYKRK